jgi:tetratricopeptide (TPR) repeat protein
MSCQWASCNPIVPPDTARLNAMAREAMKLVKDKSKSGQADSIVQMACQIAASGKIQLPPLLLWAKARIAFKNMDYSVAYEIAAEAMKSPPEQFGLQDRGELAIFFAKTCQYTGQFSFGIEILEKNIEFAKSNHLTEILPWSYNGLADIYELVNKNTDAIQSLEQMRETAKQGNYLSAAETAFSRLGRAMLTYNRNFTLANEYYKQSLDISIHLRDSARISRALTNLGWNFYLEKNLDSSLVYYKKSLDYSIPARYYSTLANSYGNIGTIYCDKKEFGQAVAAWKNGIVHAMMVNDWYSLSWIYNDMSRMSASTGEYKNAYEYQLLYKQYSDSVESHSFTEKIAQSRAKFDSDSKEKELQLLSLRLKNQRLLLYGFTGFLALSLVIGLLLLRQWRSNTKRRISEMDQRILEVTQANLRQQMNPHFIFNTLNSIQYYMYKHDKLATNNYLTKFSNLMRKILENSQHTAVSVRDEIDALQLYLELESIRFRGKFDYEIDVDDEIDPLIYKIPTMLIQPYVENSICHGLMLRPEKGKVVISLSLKEEYLTCIIEDNGIGREASREINLKKQHQHNSLGTRITESRLNLVNSFYGKSLRILYTDLKDEFGIATGTRVEIHIPILT